MIYRTFKDKQISLLGFGGMRLPTNADGSVNISETGKMVDYALSHGINYFDTAFPYHGGKSETVLGAILNKYPRDSWYLADKYPGHQIAESYDPASLFEEQLAKCGVEYFDFYLLHNVCENSYAVYNDEKWGIIPYFIEQRRLGRIRHLGFSTHARPDTLLDFVTKYGADMDFCQIQLNYLDESMQCAADKYEMLTAHHIPVVVMEPLRGGKLANVPSDIAEEMHARRKDDSPAAWSFKHLERFDNILTILSGMSSMAQLEENVRIFEKEDRLSDGEVEFLHTAAEHMKNAVPCTACGYCKKECPMELDIPMLLAAYSDMRYQSASVTIPMQIDALPDDKKPSACLGCGACAAMCPQKIDIPACMSDFADIYAAGPHWAEVCKKRAEEAKKNREQASK